MREMTDTKKKLCDTIGFYYLIFLPQPDNYVRCWIDGAEDYTLYTREEILAFSQAAGINYKLRLDLQEALSTYSVYIWDVENETIKTLTLEPAENNLGELLAQRKQKVLADRELKKKNIFISQS